MHEQGFIKTMFDRPEVLDDQTLKNERDAKIDIYNYAARYGCTPKIMARDLPVPRVRGRRVRKTTEVTVELLEQKIRVIGLGHDIFRAEIAAAVKFKAEAEKYHATQGTDLLVIKDSTALNLDNAPKFFDFYKMITPDADIKTEVTPQQISGRTRSQAKLFINNVQIGDTVEMSTKSKVQDLVQLSAAVAITQENPAILPEFLKALRTGNGEILKPVSPVDMSVDEDCVFLMQDTLRKARQLGLADKRGELESELEAPDVKSRRSRHYLGPMEADIQSRSLESAYRRYLEDPKLAELRRKREELPMNQFRAQVLGIVANNTYSIIMGATGSGKTTQVPQILLEEATQSGNGALCNVICTQPRRIAATSVAKRVADERAENLQESVGYHVRFDSKLPKHGGSITYCTTGILLQQLQHSPDEILDNTSHLIIDEVHERDILIDFLLIVIKKVVGQRVMLGKSTPKVVLMSATMDAELFASYFKNGGAETGFTKSPILSVPGRSFPVTENYLESILEVLDTTYGAQKLQTMYSDPQTREFFAAEQTFAKENPMDSSPSNQALGQNGQEDETIIDWKKERILSSDGELITSTDAEDALVPLGLVATTIAHIAKSTDNGAVLVFLPGLDEMVKVDNLLRNESVLDVNFKDETKYKIYMLHSSIAATQTDVFTPVPSGCRKIILGTNIAETSITIPDVQYVIDTGKLREKRYDQMRRITKLQCTWISKSNSKQRAGRAGRVQNGNYYALFSKPRYNSLRAIGLPEILRSDLQEICLDIKAQSFKSPIREFLAQAIESPAPVAVDAAVKNLQALDAITEDEKLTALGRLLASLPVHPGLGKMIVLGIIFRCLDPMLLLGAAVEERGLFVSPLTSRNEARAAKMSFLQGSGSDHIAFLNAFGEGRYIRETAGQQALWEFGKKNFLHLGAFRSIDNTAKQIEEVLVGAGLIPAVPARARANFQYGHPMLNQNSNKSHVIKALALAGLHPNLAVAQGRVAFRTPGEKSVIPHTSSCNASVPRKGIEAVSFERGALLTYSTMMKSNDGNSIFLRDTTESTPLMAALFGGHLKFSDRSSRILEMDDWLPFYVKSDDYRAAKTIMEFRKALERLLTGAFRDLSNKRSLAEDPVREKFAEGLVEVLNRDVRLKETTLQKGWGRAEQTSAGDGGGPRFDGKKRRYERRL